MEKIIKIKYREYNNPDELTEQERELYNRAVIAADSAYAKYSNFNVGAALLLENGEITSASNQENAAYPSGLCAERTALFYTHSKYPNEAVVAIAIVAKVDGKLVSGVTYPCGACLQVMNESQKRGGKNIKVIMGGSGKIQIVDSVNALMPFAFNNLPK